jgi:hypothetical protein
MPRIRLGKSAKERCGMDGMDHGFEDDCMMIESQVVPSFASAFITII